MGHDFLRHIERTRLLIHIIDAAGVDGRSPLEDYRQINEELTLYDERLSKLPQIVVANKADLPQAEKGIKELRQALGEENVCVISAVTGSGVKQVLYKAAEMLAQLPPAELPENQWF